MCMVAPPPCRVAPHRDHPNIQLPGGGPSIEQPPLHVAACLAAVSWRLALLRLLLPAGRALVALGLARRLRSGLQQHKVLRQRAQQRERHPERHPGQLRGAAARQQAAGGEIVQAVLLRRCCLRPCLGPSCNCSAVAAVTGSTLPLLLTTQGSGWHVAAAAAAVAAGGLRSRALSPQSFRSSLHIPGQLPLF